MVMKRLTLFVLVLTICMAGRAQNILPKVPEVPKINLASDVPEDSIFIRIEQEPMLGGGAFARCFTPCDLNGNGIVTYAEAAQATELGLSRGGRQNIIGNYDFLKHFPNLKRLDVGNTPVEEIDLTQNTKLEEVFCGNALWLKKVKLAKGCSPRIYYPDMEGDFTVTIVSPDK